MSRDRYFWDDLLASLEPVVGERGTAEIEYDPVRQTLTVRVTKPLGLYHRRRRREHTLAAARHRMRSYIPDTVRIDTAWEKPRGQPSEA